MNKFGAVARNVIGLGLIVSSVACNALGLSTITPPNAPLDISYLFTTSAWVHGGISIGGRDYLGHEILAPADGMVVLVNGGRLGGYHVRIHHGPDIDKGEIYTEYFHVYDPAVREGDQIKRGQRMGSIEQPGFRRVRGTVHYHYLVVRGTENSLFPLNPHDYWVGIDQYKANREEGLDIGPFVIPCFEPMKNYQRLPIRFSYPAKCKDS